MPREQGDQRPARAFLSSFSRSAGAHSLRLRIVTSRPSASMTAVRRLWTISGVPSSPGMTDTPNWLANALTSSVVPLRNDQIAGSAPTLAACFDSTAGVSSFSHFGGVNFQNAHNFEEYVRILNEDRLPLLRAVSLTPKQRLIREMVLQLKTGWLDTKYFQKKFGVDVWKEFQHVYEDLENQSLLHRDNGTITLSRRGLLQVDHFLLDFFEPELRTVRYA